MYLKRLEMSGFKSFANRTEVAFVPGITAIVGPNGSGKSNVTDGIRWVLGEQSAKSLRGAKMEDIIFAGSSTRKPVGFCEVSITFDNTEQRFPYDYAEVSITRRIYRSGDSEYFLNKQPCRLKDINELFMDTGIGKEAYSVISQGRIDEILSTKSEDRRAIFEEAAGIVKYKTRKREAEKKLEGTAQNLARIRDLIHELESQIEPLREQSQVATQYKTWKQELKENEVGLYVHKISELHEEWAQTTKEVERLSDQQIALSTELAQRDAELSACKHLLLEKEEAWDQQQSELLLSSEQLEKAEGQQRVITERIFNQENSLQNEQQQAQQNEEEIHTLQKAREQMTQLLGEKEQEWQLAEEKLQKLSQQLQELLGDEHQQLAHLENQWQEQESHRLIIENEQKHAREQVEELDEQIDLAVREEEQWQNKWMKCEQHLQDLQEQRVSKEEQIANLVRQYQQQESAMHEVVETERNSALTVQKIQQDVTKVRSKYESLKEIQDSHDGFFYGVKEVLQARDQGLQSLQKVEGAIAELLEVDAKYETAIETALGNASQHLVVADEETGRSGIQYLKAKQLGRATFLPLDVIKPRSLSTDVIAQLEKQEGFVGIASRIVRTKTRFQPVIDNLLGTVLIAKDLPTANQLARQLHYRYRIVSLEGDVVNPGGSMSGGSRQKNRSNILGRTRQLTELAQQLEEKEHHLHKEEQQLRQYQVGKEQVMAQLEQLRAQGEQLRQQAQELKTQEREREMEAINIQERLDQVNLQIKVMTEKREGLSDQQLHQNEEIQTIQSTLVKWQQEITQMKEQIQKNSQTKETTLAQVTEAKVQVAKCKQALEHEQQTEQRYTEQWKRLVLANDQMRDNITAHLTRLQSYQTEQKTELQQLSNLRENKEQAYERVQVAKYQREQLQKDREQQELQVRELERQVKKKQETLHQQEVRTNRLDVELNHCLQKLSEEYEMSYERAKESVEIPENPGKIERLVRSLKQRIAALGEVNVGAIEEFERLHERFLFLQTQEEDLLQAKDQLYEMIDQMEGEMGSRFAETFNLIREEFQEVFVQMFGGGQADLRLTDDEQLLQTGIEIVAQPPGKRLQNLSLLSGGERSLAAIALLFAVLRVKPVPFCVLDEVDAALDEVNLSRFTRYMREFADHTQFIVITHRKQTMEGADVLYGITMQEWGVSSLVSVQLEKFTGEQEVAVTTE